MTKASVKKPRLPQRRRAQITELPPFRLTKRDVGIIYSAYTYRALTTQQVSDLHFVPDTEKFGAAPSSRCLQRLKLLYQHGFLQRIEQPQLLIEGRKPFLYLLDKRGAEWLVASEGDEIEELSWRAVEELSPFFLEHLLTTNTVRIAVVRAARKHGFAIEQWLDDRTLKQMQNKETVLLSNTNGKPQIASLVPDGYFLLCAGTHYYHHFLEIDRATTTGISGKWGRRTWARKVATYLEYYRSGKYHVRYHTRSMRVLIVTTDEKRLANLKHITEECGGKSRFWFTTLQAIATADILLDPVWHVASREGLQSLVW